MATTEPKEEERLQSDDGPHEGSSVATSGWKGKLEEKYRQMKEHVEIYPYVWSSYVLVYGGLGLWLAYRWRKLRQTEDRVRTLQARLQALVDQENAAKSLPDKPPIDKPPE